jgi:hypothetical protein
MSAYKPSEEMMDLIYEPSKQIRKYRIICLKRSTWFAKEDETFISDWYGQAKLVYWMDNYSGYTSIKQDAGLYTLKELEGAAGSHGDWLIEPVWVDVE